MEQKTSIKFDSVVVQTKGLVAADLDEEKVMMSIDRGKYYAMNSVGSCIWELIDKPRSVEEIVSRLMDEYDVDSETCRTNVIVFLSKLYHEGLVCVD